MESELKSCPFCGGEAEYYSDCDMVKVRCSACGANTSGWWDEPEEAATDWNRRPSPENNRFENCHIYEDGDHISDFPNNTEIVIKAKDIPVLTGKLAFENAPENKALTLDELRKMDGEPVYLVYPSDQSANHWEIIYLVVQQYDANGAPIGDEWVRMTSGASERANDYAKTWLAYRAKPEED